jgi:outer membrane lipoprotein-sorting protein
MSRLFLRVLACAAALIAARVDGEPLADILARMDLAAKDFKSVSAKTKHVDFTAVLNESSESSGEMKMKRGKAGITGLVDFTQPDRRTLYINGRTAERYFPNAKTVEVYDTSKFSQSMDQFLLLGFGTSGTELEKAYTVKLGGVETLNTIATTRSEVTPKSRELLKVVCRSDLCIAEGQSTPVQEKLFEPSRNYLLITYSDVKVNPPLPDSAFELKLPAGVKKIAPQK